METFDFGKTMADMWTLGEKAFLEAQKQALRAMREGTSAMAMPGGVSSTLPGFAFNVGDITQAQKALADLWSSATGMASTLAQKLPSSVDADSTAAATFRRMVDPRVWLVGGDDIDEALQRMAEGPQLADLWDVERKYAKVFQAWMTLRRHNLEHQAVVLEGWTTAARRFTDRLGELASKGESPTSQRAALTIWIEIANHALLEMQRSERYLASQTEILKASTELRFAQREVAEYYALMFGVPTRTELDDVHRTVTELRRELRTVQRKLRAAPIKTPVPEQDMGAAAEGSPAARGQEAKG